MPAVSVIIPVYKTEKYLRRCIESVLAQTFTDFELILVDDGSPDGCPQICDEYAEKDARVRVIHKENGGVSSARNAGLDAAEGEYVVFADSDDYVSSKYVEELMRWSDFDFVTAGFYWQDGEQVWHQREFVDEEVLTETVKKYPSKYMGKYYFGSQCKTLMRTELIKNSNVRNIKNVNSGEDTLFIFDYLKLCKNIKILPVCGYYYCFNSASLVNTVHKDEWKWKIMVERKVLDFFEPCNDEEEKSLTDRDFAVLCDSLFKYSKFATAEEMAEIFNDEFYKSCIEAKKKRGNISERLLIFAMEHKNYKIYSKTMKCVSLFKRGKMKMYRMLKRKTVKNV